MAHSSPKKNRIYKKSLIPTTSFWLANTIGWIIFAVINFLNRQALTAESLDVGIMSAIINSSVNGLLSGVFRWFLVKYKLLENSVYALSAIVIIGSVLLGFASASSAVALIGGYYYIADYSSIFIFFMSSVYANWMIMSIMILLWCALYIGCHHYFRYQRALKEHDQITLQLRDAKLNALVGQLNPHFLFNALNNIRGLMLENVEKSREMLTHLSSLLRSSLMSHSRSVSTLRDELELVHSYVELAQIQYESRLNYQDEVPDELMNWKLPPLVLQLLVENAVRHGIDRVTDVGLLKVQCRKDNSLLIVTVSNPGSLNLSDNRSLPNQKTEQSSGIGLNNIRQRLSLLYGGSAQLEVVEKNFRVIATLQIPESIKSKDTSTSDTVKQI